MSSRSRLERARPPRLSVDAGDVEGEVKMNAVQVQISSAMEVHSDFLSSHLSLWVGGEGESIKKKEEVLCLLL